MKYTHYTLYTNKVRNNWAKLAPKKERKALKGKTTGHCLSQTFRLNPEAYTPFRQSIAFKVLAEEEYWLNSKRTVLYPASIPLIDRLLKAKYTIKHADKIKPPPGLESFILAMPKGYQHDGVKIPATLVTIKPYLERATGMYKKFDDTLGHHSLNLTDDQWREDQLNQMHQGGNPDDYQVTILFNGSLNGRQTHHFNQSRCFLSRLIEAVDTKDLAEFLKIIPPFAGPLTDEEHELTRIIYKTLAAMLVYMSAMDGKALKAGFPTKDMSLKDLNVKPNPITFTDPLNVSVNDNTRIGHTRNWHFRQLNHSKFYQGEHEHKPIGSRIVFVRESTVGKVDAKRVVTVKGTANLTEIEA